MNRSKRAALSVCSLLLALSANCGIEVGNPHPKKPSTTPSATTGDVSLALADAPIDNAQHVYFTIRSLSIVPTNSDGSDGTPVSVALAASGKIDALSLHDGKSLGLTTSQPLPTGNYSAVILGLDSDSPASIVDQAGAEQPLPFGNASHEIAVAQQFQVADGQTLSLVLHIDLRRSITAHSGDHSRPFDFAPVASLGRQEQEAKITGTTVSANVSEVCAYLRLPHSGFPGDDDHLHPPGPRPGNRPPSPHGQGLPPGSVVANPPPRFDPDAEFDVGSEDSGCGKAFAVAAVTSKAFMFEHLWPGDYRLVYFNQDGTRATAAAQEVTVALGQAVAVTQPAQ